ncbi:MAG: Ig-like domain-containing protein, partial [Chloroflexi bacterium]|nr:Ig-like domain-containing protein [Chloroflexota bacterium]
MSAIDPAHYSDLFLSPIEDDVPEFPTADNDEVSTPEETETEPPVSVSPAGRDLSPYSPLTITFRNPPQESNPRQVVSIDPHLDGTLGWPDDSTLLFRPAAPGWQQGQQYQLVILAAALGAESDFSHTFIAGGGLEVAYFVPGDGDIEVPVDAQILVQFNRSVAPLTVLSDVSGPSVLEFQPPLEGAGEWLNTSLFRFKPDSLAPSTNYTVRVRAGLTSAIGEQLISNFSWSFTTVQPAVVAVTPSDGAKRIALDSPIIVTFNQPMDRESVESLLRIGDFRAELVGTLDWNDDLTTVRFTPADALDLGRVYIVVAPEGLRSANGGASLAKRSSRFNTIPWPRLIRTSPRNGATDAGRTSISPYYNTPIDPGSLEDRIAISEIDWWSIDLPRHYWFEYSGEFTARFDVNLDYSTTYTVTIAEGVHDQDGRLAPAHEFRFTTDHPPNWPILSLASRSSFSTMSTDRDQVVRFNAARIGEVRFEIFELSQQESDVFLRRGAIYGARSILAEAASIPASDWPDREPVRRWSLEIEPSQQEEVRLHSTVLGEDTPLERGHYLLVATPDQTWDGEEEQFGRWLMISVVDTAMIIKHAAGELVVWALDHDTGEPLAEVPVLAASMGYTADSP